MLYANRPPQPVEGVPDKQPHHQFQRHRRAVGHRLPSRFAALVDVLQHALMGCASRTNPEAQPDLLRSCVHDAHPVWWIGKRVGRRRERLLFDPCRDMPNVEWRWTSGKAGIGPLRVLLRLEKTCPLPQRNALTVMGNDSTSHGRIRRTTTNRRRQSKSRRRQRIQRHRAVRSHPWGNGCGRQRRPGRRTRTRFGTGGRPTNTT